MRRYRRAVLLALVCALVLAGGLLRAYLQAERPLRSTDVLAATRRAVDEAVDAAIRRGGLFDAMSFLGSAIRDELHRQGFPVSVRVQRPNDLNPWAAFQFYVEANGLFVRFDIRGTRDPLLAIRLGEDRPIRADPYHPYAIHREPAVLAACLDGRYYHTAPDGPDLFARLENRTRPAYAYGFETLLTDGGALAVDHVFLETGAWGLDAEHRARYGL